MEEVDEMRIFPDDPDAEERLANKLTSYILNSYVTVEPKEAGHPPTKHL